MNKYLILLFFCLFYPKSYGQNNTTIIVGGYDKLRAIDGLSGITKWEFLAGNCTNPTINNGVVYVGSDDMKFYALNASTGQKKWEIYLGSKIDYPPIVIGDYIYFQTRAKFYSCNKIYGTTLWEYNISNYFGNFTMNNGIIYLSDWDYHKTHKINAYTGQKIGEISNTLGENPTIFNGRLILGIKAFNLYTENYLTTYQTSNLNVSNPLISNGMIFFGCGDGKLYAFDFFNATKKWEFTTTNSISTHPTIENDIILFSSKDGKIYAISS